MLNTFASHILCTLSLPLLIYWPFTRGRWMANQHAKTIREDKGEFQLNVSGGEEVKHKLYLLIVRFILLSAIKVTAAGSSFTLCVNCVCKSEVNSYFLLPKYVNENMYCMIGTTTTLPVFNGLFSRTTRVSRHQKGKPF